MSSYSSDDEGKKLDPDLALISRDNDKFISSIAIFHVHYILRGNENEKNQMKGRMQSHWIRLIVFIR